METTLHALGGILLRAVPTFLLVILLNIYLKQVFFKPLKRVLDARYAATEGAHKTAEETLARAKAKAAECDAALRTARAEVYQAQEQLHRKLQQQREADVHAARERADAAIRQAKAELDAEMVQVKAALASQSETLADDIARTILRGRAA